MNLEGGHIFTKHAEEWFEKRMENMNFEGEDIYSFSTRVDLSFGGVETVSLETLLVNKEDSKPFTAEDIISEWNKYKIDTDFGIEIKTTELEGDAVKDDLVYFIETCINKVKQSNIIYTELMPIGVCPIQTKYVLQPIQLISELNDNIVVT
ncbi:hypothetical protein CKG27_13385, partial [Listeria monocytogenes]|nr:hypothetical protein [Listeria monocytogenes]